MDYDQKIEELTAETRALRALVLALVSGIIALNENNRGMIESAFDNAEGSIEAEAFKSAGGEGGASVAAIAEVIEALRKNALGDPDSPKGGV